MKKLISLLFVGFIIFSSPVWAMENLFYILHSKVLNKKLLDDLQQNVQSINILVSQAYQIDKNGEVTGFINPEMQDFAKKNNVKFVVLVTNKDFDDEIVHKFLENTEGKQKAIKFILDQSVKNHYDGVQFDFEMVPLKDRDKLTHFFKEATDELHARGFTVSFAVAPVVEHRPDEPYFQKKLYKVWEGAYDLGAISKFADFVSIMAYNQHDGGTTPGPTASLPWVQQAVQYALRYLPPQKISLGIATYSGHWYTGTEPGHKAGRVSQHMDAISYEDVVKILQSNNARLWWSYLDKANFSIFERNWLNEYLFVEDAQSFQAKLNLARQFNLRGISVFDLGIEDPKIWQVLKIKPKRGFFNIL
jgi:spore germination protein YaaH